VDVDQPLLQVDLDRPIVPDRTVDALVDDVLRVRKQCVEAVVAGDIVVLVLRLLDVPLVLVDPPKASASELRAVVSNEIMPRIGVWETPSATASSAPGSVFGPE